MLKKIVLLLLVLTLAASFCLHISALESDLVRITIDNIDVVFDTNSSLTHAEKQFVAEHLTSNIPSAQSYGLICNLFGHKETTEIVTTITHCVRTTVPRCFEEEWELTICTRCETLIDETRIGYLYIDCCPVD